MLQVSDPGPSQSWPCMMAEECPCAEPDQTGMGCNHVPVWSEDVRDQRECLTEGDSVNAQEAMEDSVP